MSPLRGPSGFRGVVRHCRMMAVVPPSKRTAATAVVVSLRQIVAQFYAWINVEEPIDVTAREEYENAVPPPTIRDY